MQASLRVRALLSGRGRVHTTTTAVSATTTTRKWTRGSLLSASLLLREAHHGAAVLTKCSSRLIASVASLRAATRKSRVSPFTTSTSSFSPTSLVARRSRLSSPLSVHSPGSSFIYRRHFSSSIRLHDSTITHSSSASGANASSGNVGVASPPPTPTPSPIIDTNITPEVTEAAASVNKTIIDPNFFLEGAKIHPDDNVLIQFFKQYTPVSYTQWDLHQSFYDWFSLPLQAYFEAIHNVLGVEWWVAISIGGVAIRLVLFPFVKKQIERQYSTASGANMRRLAQLRQDIALYPERQMELRQEMTKVSSDHMSDVFKNMRFMFYQMPLIIGAYVTMRRMCATPFDEVAFPGFLHEGALWFSNLVATDPYRGLALFTSASFVLLSVRFVCAARL